MLNESRSKQSPSKGIEMQFANALSSGTATLRFNDPAIGKQVMGEHHYQHGSHHLPEPHHVERSSTAPAAIVPRPESPVLIRITSGAGVGETVGIDLDRFTIGSNPRCEICFPELHGGGLGGIGGKGAKVRREPEGWMLHPHSSGRVYINNEPVADVATLRTGDTIRFSHDGPEIQFLIQHQNQRPLHQIAEDYAPHLIKNFDASASDLSHANMGGAVDGSPAPGLRVVSDSVGEDSSDRMPSWSGAAHSVPHYATERPFDSLGGFLIEYGRTIIIAAAIVATALIALAAILLSDQPPSEPKTSPAAVQGDELPATPSDETNTQVNVTPSETTAAPVDPSAGDAPEDEESPFAD